jgi:hypothetical protein
MLWAVKGLVGRFGKPIRVRLEIRLDTFLGVKLAGSVSSENQTTCANYANSGQGCWIDI